MKISWGIVFFFCLLCGLHAAESAALKTRIIDLRGIMNTSYRDDLPGDFQNWTDQGPGNDLRNLKPGLLRLPEVTFQVVDPRTNRNRSVIMPSSYFCHFYPEVEFTLPLRKNLVMRTLFLLHCGAWVPGRNAVVGNLYVDYADGSTDHFPIRAEVELADWHSPKNWANARLAWSGKTADFTDCGLFYSALPIQNKPVKALRFAKGSAGTWAVFAASYTEQEYCFPEIKPFIAIENDEWKDFETSREVVEGSILDFSFLNHNPAGKYGFLKNVNGELVPEQSEEPIRFYGTNICLHALFMSHEQADLLAKRLAALGYNSVRIHHYDGLIVDADQDGNFKINEEKLDQLNYLIAALKKQGIYLITDLYNSRKPVKAKFQKSCPEIEGDRDYKCAAIFYPEVREDLKEFARLVWGRVNPYTGLTWAQDPAFLAFGVINEDTLILNIEQIGLCGDSLKKRFYRDFEAYCNEKKIMVTPKNRLAEYYKYLGIVYREFFADMENFMRGELGIRVPIGDQNNGGPSNIFPEQVFQYGFFDNHPYWDHPQFPQWVIKNKSMIACGYPNLRVLASYLNVPLFWTESNFVYPNSFRSEEGMIYGAYASYKGLNGIWHFDYSHSRERMFNNTEIDCFDSVNDPVKWLSERMLVLLFRRQDATPGFKRIAVAVKPGTLYNNVPSDVRELALVARAELVIHEGNGRFSPELNPDTVAIYSLDEKLQQRHTSVPIINGDHSESAVEKLQKLLGIQFADGDTLTTLNGEITTDFKTNSARVVTPRHEAFVLPAGEEEKGSFLTVRNGNVFVTAGAAAMDGKPLADSQKVLLMHISDVLARGMTFDSADRTQVTNYVGGKPLGRHAQSTFLLPERAKKLYAIDLDGTRIAEIPLIEQGDSRSFIADTTRYPGHLVFAYELLCE